ncbi:MAG: flippase-like domain-containing protein, partial [Micromonosporaceae bacterium]|nr:flippase-like domain-containing protein [Micromonosporaceae bacterium]
MLPWIRMVGGLAVLAVLVWRLGTGPFLHGVRMIDGWALAAALGIGALTTVCCAWRWCLVARALHIRLPLGSAVAHCYRATFLNATLPGGVLGDVHRAVSHGRDEGSLSRGVRAVTWERFAGQAVQAVLALVILFALPSPVRSHMPSVALLVLAGGLGLVLLLWALSRRARRDGTPDRVGGRSRLELALGTAVADIRDGLLARRTWPGVVFASAVVIAGHVATFLVAARTADATVAPLRLIPLAILALLAMSLPLNVGGWGPREGVAAWAFGAAGLTASAGIAVAVIYGALVLVAALPGAGVLLVQRLARAPRRSAGQT